MAALNLTHSKRKLLVLIMDIDFGSNLLSYHALVLFLCWLCIWWWCAASLCSSGKIYIVMFLICCDIIFWRMINDLHFCKKRLDMLLVLSMSLKRKNALFVSLRRSQIIGRFEEGQHVERMDTSSNEPSADTSLLQRQGRSERRYLANKHVCCSC